MNSQTLAQEFIPKTKNDQRKNYDLKVRGLVIKPGDKMLVKIVGFDGRHTLSDEWEINHYIVHKRSTLTRKTKQRQSDIASKQGNTLNWIQNEYDLKI